MAHTFGKVSPGLKMKINNAICHGASLCPLVLGFSVVCSDSKGKNSAKNLKRQAKVGPQERPQLLQRLHTGKCAAKVESSKDTRTRHQGRSAQNKLQEIHCVHYNGIINRSDCVQIGVLSFSISP